MDSLLRIALINVASAAVLALAVTVATRWIRRPEIVHALWVAVLLKLLMPPVVELALLPQLSVPIMAAGHATVGSSGPAIAGSLGLSAESGGSAVGAPSWVELALALWLAGVVALFGLALVRAVRFERALRCSGEEPAGALRIRTARLADRLGLRQVPRVHVVGARISPMLWFTPGGLRLLLPGELLTWLTPRPTRRPAGARVGPRAAPRSLGALLRAARRCAVLVESGRVVGPLPSASGRGAELRSVGPASSSG